MAGVKTQPLSRYPPLPSTRAIRLLKIQHGTTDDPVRIVLEAFILDYTLPQYSALSYTWDGPVAIRARLDECSVAETIYVACGVEQWLPLQVTKNLHEALQQLRVNGEFGWIWIDAVCIHQSDQAEVVSQILLVGHIYSGAQRVVAWLGRADDMTDSVVWFHTIFWEKLSKHVDVDDDASYEAQFQRTGPILRELGTLSEEDKMRLFMFYRQSRYLTRTWIVQELVLSREVTVMYGSQALPWHAMAPLHKFMTNLPNENAVANIPPSTEKAGTGVAMELRHLQRIQRLHQRGGPHSPDIAGGHWPIYGAVSELERCVAYLEWILAYTRYFSATKPVDHICSTLGLLSPFWPSSEPPLIVPDYQMPVAKFKEMATTKLIEAASRLTVLSLVEDLSERHDPDQPSWVPNFSTRILPDLILLATGLPLDCLARLKYDKTQVTISNGRLHVTGWKCDRIIDIVRTPFYIGLVNSDDHSPLILFYESAVRFYQQLDPFYINGQVAAAALISALSADITYERIKGGIGKAFGMLLVTLLSGKLVKMRSTTDTSKLTEDARAAVHKCISMLEGISSPYLPKVSEVEDTVKLHERLGVDNDRRKEWVQQVIISGTEFTDVVSRTQDSRRSFLTASKLLGLGPLSTQDGDELWMVLGSPVPLVMRPTQKPNEYVLVGECYVHGAMFGELVPFATSEGLEEIVIV